MSEPEAVTRAMDVLNSQLATSHADLRQALRDLLAEYDELAKRALPDPKAGCTCTWHTQDAGSGYTEHLLEYEPTCPEHSEHLYDPRTGVWVLREAEPTADEIEAAALASYASDLGDGDAFWLRAGNSWATEDEPYREVYRASARAALLAARAVRQEES